jgi:hypothetical protein
MQVRVKRGLGQEERWCLMTLDVDGRNYRGRSPRKMLVAGGLSAGILAAVGVFGASGASAVPARAVAARTVNLNESGSLRLTSSHGLILNEKGTASGTIKGSIYIHLNVSSTNRVTAEVSIYPSGGSLTGNGSANYRVTGSNASFAGTLSITRGTGHYAHARASGLRFTGTIARKTDAVTVHVSGRLSE